MTFSVPHSVSVAGVVVDDAGRVLMTQRRDNGRWEAPGGVLEPGECILDGLRREVREETGLEIIPERLTGVYQNMRRGVIALVFRARVAAGEPRPSPETVRVEWWDPRLVPTRTDEAYAVRVLDALADGDPAVRPHDGVGVLRHLPGLPG